MKRILYSMMLLSAFLSFLGGCKKEAPDLISFASQIKSITVYDLENLSGPKYSEQDLKNAFQAPFDPKLFRELASEAKFKNKWIMWKGSSLAVVSMNDGTERQLALSYYGAFFKILGEEGYFFFEGEAGKKWDTAFLKAIVEDDFIPKRNERNKRMEEASPKPLQQTSTRSAGPGR